MMEQFSVGQTVLAPVHRKRTLTVGTIARRRELADGSWQYDVTHRGCCTWEFIHESEVLSDPLTDVFTDLMVP